MGKLGVFSPLFLALVPCAALAAAGAATTSDLKALAESPDLRNIRSVPAVQEKAPEGNKIPQTRFIGNAPEEKTVLTPSTRTIQPASSKSKSTRTRRSYRPATRKSAPSRSPIAPAVNRTPVNVPVSTPVQAARPQRQPPARKPAAAPLRPISAQAVQRPQPTPASAKTAPATASATTSRTPAAATSVDDMRALDALLR